MAEFIDPNPDRNKLIQFGRIDLSIYEVFGTHANPYEIMRILYNSIFQTPKRMPFISEIEHLTLNKVTFVLFENETGKIELHRIVLALYSQQYSEIFTSHGNYVELYEEKLKEYISGLGTAMTFNTMLSIVRFMYLGTIYPLKDNGNVDDLDTEKSAQVRQELSNFLQFLTTPLKIAIPETEVQKVKVEKAAKALLSFSHTRRTLSSKKKGWWSRKKGDTIEPPTEMKIVSNPQSGTSRRGGGRKRTRATSSEKDGKEKSIREKTRRTGYQSIGCNYINTKHHSKE